MDQLVKNSKKSSHILEEMILMNIEIIQEDITNLNTKAIVNPANSNLIMGGGLAGIIKDKGGRVIESEAKKKAPVKVGEAIITTAGDLPSKFVIHAPTMEKPAQPVPPKNARLAMEAILNCGEQDKIEAIAVPGLGTGVGGINSIEAAEEMMKATKRFNSEKLEKVIFVGYGDDLHKAFLDKKEEIID